MFPFLCILQLRDSTQAYVSRLNWGAPGVLPRSKSAAKADAGCDTMCGSFQGDCPYCALLDSASKRFGGARMEFSCVETPLASQLLHEGKAGSLPGVEKRSEALLGFA